MHPNCYYCCCCCCCQCDKSSLPVAAAALMQSLAAERIARQNGAGMAHIAVHCTHAHPAHIVLPVKGVLPVLPALPVLPVRPPVLRPGVAGCAGSHTAHSAVAAQHCTAGALHPTLHHSKSTKQTSSHRTAWHYVALPFHATQGTAWDNNPKLLDGTEVHGQLSNSSQRTLLLQAELADEGVKTQQTRWTTMLCANKGALSSSMAERKINKLDGIVPLTYAEAFEAWWSVDAAALSLHHCLLQGPQCHEQGLA